MHKSVRFGRCKSSHTKEGEEDVEKSIAMIKGLIKMTKMSSAKNANSANKAPVMEQGKSTSKPKKMGDEIDEIFAGKKRKKPEKDNAETKKSVKDSSAKVEPHNKMKIKNRIPEENLFAEAPSRARKKTGDGLAIYTEDELGIGKPHAGGTPLCPFDCDCCF